MGRSRSRAPAALWSIRSLSGKGTGTLLDASYRCTPLTAGISNHLMVSLIRQAVEQCAGQGAESLPASLRAAHQLVPAERACRDIHFPEDFDALGRRGGG